MNSYAIGFVAVLGVVGLGVDYHQQSTKAGLSLGQMGPGDYVATISARIDGAKAEKMAKLAESNRKKAWKEGGKPFLPDAPAGWVRRGFDEGDNTAILPARRMKKMGTHGDANYLAAAKMLTGPDGGGSKAGAGIANLMGQRSAADIREEVATRSWVYERGDESVFVEIKTHKAPGLNSLVGNVAATIDASFGGLEGSDRGFAVIGGVGFTEALNSDGQHPNHYRILNGRIGFGQELRIRVHANASTASTREILEAIDYDGLNALLRTPMASVGNGMTPPPGTEQEKLAEAMLSLRQEFETLLAQEAQYRVQNINGGALMINTLAQGYGAGVDGVTDLTGGKAVNMETLIRAGYRQAMRDLMEGRDGYAALGEVGQSFGVAVAQNQAQLPDAEEDSPMPEMPKMSAALAAELGVLESVDSPGDGASQGAGSNAPGSLEGRKADAKKVAKALGMNGSQADATIASMSSIARMVEQDNAGPQPRSNEPAVQKNEESGGFMSGLRGLFGGGEKSGTVRQSREKVEIRRLGSGGGTRLGSGGGCGAGKFCEAKDQK
ncbi:hypothetical protein [Marimonas arenosa]|uniref:Uncharacterized protein n=1 Tax=Marimonas arenosa TaxID=1795305 RepID=A0AAE3WGG5_9RHOB|nr:hypothetical protein [Marimonas arenosa]MDQ2091965.1 hypothetical protein [Marimonas arenosa]